MSYCPRCGIVTYDGNRDHNGQDRHVVCTVCSCLQDGAVRAMDEILQQDNVSQEDIENIKKLQKFIKR